MTGTLYTAQIAFDTVVLAEDPDDAYFAIEAQLEKIIEEAVDFDIKIKGSVESEKDLEEWMPEARPYGSNASGLTCRQILASGEEYKRSLLIKDLKEKDKDKVLSQLDLSQLLELIKNCND